MKQLALSLALFAVLAGCKKQSSPIVYSSPLKFEKTEFSDETTFAKIQGDPVTKEQLFNNSPGLKETQELYFNHLFLEAYKLASNKFEKSNQPVKINFYGEVTKKDWPKWLEALKIKVDEKITTNFLPPQSDLIAEIGNEKFSHRDLIKRDATLLKVQRRLFDEKMRKLSGLTVRRLLMEESKKRNMNLSELIEKDILTSMPTVNDEDATEFALEKGLSKEELDKNKGALLKQFKDILLSQKRDEIILNHVAKNLIKEPIQVEIEPPVDEVIMPEFDDMVPQFGSGSVSVIVFSNPVCESCKDVNLMVERWRKDGKFKVNYLFFMNPNERQARMVSEAALCVYNKHKTKFWDFLNQYQSQGEKIDEQLIYQTAGLVGADSEQFKKCFLTRERRRDA